MAETGDEGGGGGGGGTGGEGGELEIITTVEGESDDALVFDDGAEGGGVGIDEGDGGFDFDDFVDVADLKGDVNAADLGDLEFDASADLGGEAGAFDAKGVEAGAEGGEAIDAFLVGGGGSGGRGGGVGDGDVGTGDEGPAGVGDGSGDLGGGDLRKNGRGYAEAERYREHMAIES